MAKSRLINPVLYDFFRFFSFTLLLTIVFLLFVIYLLVNKEILPNFKLSHRKLDGRIAYFDSNNQLNIYDGGNGKSINTQLKNSSYPARPPLWSPDGKKVIVNYVTGNDYRYYDIQKKTVTLLRMPFSSQVEVAGWVNADTLVISDYLNLYSVNLRGQNKKTLCSDCTYAGFDNQALNNGRKMAILKESGGSNAAYILELNNLTETAVRVDLPQHQVESFDVGSFSFDQKGDRLAFSLTVKEPTLNNFGSSTNKEFEPVLVKKMGVWDIKASQFKEVKPENVRNFFNPLTPSQVYINGFPQFSPDSSFLAFKGILGDSNDDYLFKAAVEGTGPEIVSQISSDSSGYSWSPDSTWLVFRDQKGSLRVASQDGRNNFFLVNNASNPAWSPN